MSRPIEFVTWCDIEVPVIQIELAIRLAEEAQDHSGLRSFAALLGDRLPEFIDAHHAHHEEGETDGIQKSS